LRLAAHLARKRFGALAGLSAAARPGVAAGAQRVWLLRKHALRVCAASRQRKLKSAAFLQLCWQHGA